MYDFLDQKWLLSGVMKRKSNYSPVLCFETVDPKRLSQLKRFLLTSGEMGRMENVFLWDPWDGLGTLRMGADGPVFEPYRKRIGPQSPISSRIRGGVDAPAEIGPLRAILKEMDGFLKTSPTVFVAQNVSGVREADTGFQAALRAWAIDPGVLAKGSTIIVVTSDATQIMDEFTREFAVIIEVDPANASEREALVLYTAKELGLGPEETRSEAAKVTLSGLNLHQIESILLESYHRAKGFDPDIMKELKSEMVKKSKVLEVRDPEFTFRDIGGYRSIKEFVTKYIVNVLGKPDRARHFGLGLPKGLLFFGPPGTGKSLFASALASEVQLPFINLLTENIYSKWLGESGQNMKSAISMAERMSPAIVFVDEIDRFGKRAGASAGSAEEETQRVFSQFLEWLGRPDREAIVVGTTNVPEHLDDAFLRAGRFDYKIPFLYPGPEARLEILLVHLGLGPEGKRPRIPMFSGPDETRQFLSQEIVRRTRHFSCAELGELVTRAKRFAFDRGKDCVSGEDLLSAARTFRIDALSRERTVAACMAEARKFTDDQSFLDAISRENRMDEDEDIALT